jgi:hypothetical protein
VAVQAAVLQGEHIVSEYQLRVEFDTIGDPLVIEKCDMLMGALVERVDDQIFDPAITANMEEHEVVLTMNAIGQDPGAVEALGMDRVLDALGSSRIYVGESRSRSLELVGA